MSVDLRQTLRSLLRLSPYTDEIRERITARNVVSVDLMRKHGMRGNILDVGCSSGWFANMTASFPDLTVTGIDPNDSSLQIARKSSQGATFVQGSALEIPFGDAHFNGAVMFEVIEHVPKGTEVQALSEVRRVLKPGSKFILSTPYRSLAGTLLDPAWYFGHRHYSREKLTDLLRSAGFEPEYTRVKGGWGEIFAMLQLYSCKWILRAEMPNKERMEQLRVEEFNSDKDGFTNIFVVSIAR